MTEQANTQQATEQADKFVWKAGDIEMTSPETQEFKLDGRTKRALDIAISKKQVSQESHAAVLAGRIDLAKAKELGREGSPDTPVGPAVRMNKKDRSRSCMCQCGRETKGGRFVAGHDQRLVTYAKEYVRGGRELTDEQLAYVQESGKLDRAKAQVEKEDQRKQEKAAKKAADQRRREGQAEAKKREKEDAAE